MRRWHYITTWIILVGTLIGCGQPAPPLLPPVQASPPPPPTPTVDRAEQITIGMAEVPHDLFGIYAWSFATRQIMGILQPPCLRTLTYTVEALCFDTIPSLANGTITTTTVTIDQSSPRAVVINDEVLSDTRALTQPITLEQVHVTWRIKDGVTWEDGTPVTAEDFALAASLVRDDERLLTNGSFSVLERTESIEVRDPYTFIWHGRPGYRAPTYLDTFFGPAPAHILRSRTPEAISASPYATHPLAYGPYRISEHIPEKQTTLVANEHYWAASQGLPKSTTIVIQYLFGTDHLVTGLASGAIDVASPIGFTPADLPALTALEATGAVNTLVTPIDVWEQLDFGIRQGGGYPSFFDDVRVRQAVAFALDRGAITEEVVRGTAPIMRSFLPPDHWAYPPGHGVLEPYLYNPIKAADLLDAAGWVEGPDGRRTKDGRVLAVSLYTTEHDPLRQGIAHHIQRDLAVVGIQVFIYPVASRPWMFGPGPEGILAGRRFDLALYARAGSTEPATYPYTCDQIPTAANGYTGQNNPGWCNTDFDRAAAAVAAAPDRESRVQRMIDAQTIFNAEVPSLPLFQWVTIGAARTSITGVVLDPTSAVDFWNIETWERTP